jgi:ATP-binding cassette subfamily B protein IrtB
MRNFFYNITSGNPSALLVPSLASFFDGLGKIIPAALIFDVVNTMYLFFAHPGTPLNTGRLWTVCVILLVWMLLQYLVSAWAYSQTYTAAYAVSAQGRIALAEHLRRLSLGFLGSRDPGDLTTMMLGDYAAVELTISTF